MIGQKIIEFDNLPLEKSNLKTFNLIFNLSIEGSEESLVEIGDIIIGDRRELLINGESHIVDLTQVNHFTEEGFAYKEVYELMSGDEKIGSSVNFRGVADCLGCTISTISQYHKDGKAYHGYTLNKVKVSEQEYNTILNTKLPFINIKEYMKNKDDLMNLTIELSDGFTKDFTSMREAAKFLKIPKKYIVYRIEKKIFRMLKNWKLTLGENNV